MAADNYRVCMVAFPSGDVKGAVRLDENGFATIYINDKLSPKERRAALRHELRHIAHDDHVNSKNILEIEKYSL